MPVGSISDLQRIGALRDGFWLVEIGVGNILFWTYRMVFPPAVYASQDRFSGKAICEFWTTHLALKNDLKDKYFFQQSGIKKIPPTTKNHTENSPSKTAEKPMNKGGTEKAAKRAESKAASGKEAGKAIVNNFFSREPKGSGGKRERKGEKRSSKRKRSEKSKEPKKNMAAHGRPHQNH